MGSSITLRLNKEQETKPKQIETKILNELKILKGMISGESRIPMTLSEAARYLNFTISGLYKLTCSKKIPFYKPNNKRIYFEKGELTKWLLSNKIDVERNLNEKEKELIIRKRRKRKER